MFVFVLVLVFVSLLSLCAFLFPALSPFFFVPVPVPAVPVVEVELAPVDVPVLPAAALKDDALVPAPELFESVVPAPVLFAGPVYSSVMNACWSNSSAEGRLLWLSSNVAVRKSIASWEMSSGRSGFAEEPMLCVHCG